MQIDLIKFHNAIFNCDDRFFSQRFPDLYSYFTGDLLFVHYIVVRFAAQNYWKCSMRPHVVRRNRMPFLVFTNMQREHLLLSMGFGFLVEVFMLLSSIELINVQDKRFKQRFVLFCS